jgi:flagellar hook-basal body complex protein FliE
LVMYEDTFATRPGMGYLLEPQPVEIAYADSATISVNPYQAASAVLTSIQVNDLARNVSYTWIRSTTYPNGYWQNNMAPSGMTNAPAGQSPMVTPGNNLQVAASFQNMGSVAGNFTVIITNMTSSSQITSQTISAAAQGGQGVTTLVTAAMPNSAISLTIAVTP